MSTIKFIDRRDVSRFRLRSRVVPYRGGYRWIVTDRTEAVFAVGQSPNVTKAREDARRKHLELEAA